MPPLAVSCCCSWSQHCIFALVPHGFSVELNGFVHVHRALTADHHRRQRARLALLRRPAHGRASEVGRPPLRFDPNGVLAASGDDPTQGLRDYYGFATYDQSTRGYLNSDGLCCELSVAQLRHVSASRSGSAPERCTEASCGT
jgi:hypothetical protein